MSAVGAPPLLPRVLFKGLVLIATLLAAGWLLRTVSLDTAWLDREIRGHGVAGEALFVAVGLAAVAFGLPRQVVAFGGGYAFGFAEGAVVALAAVAGACVVDFYYARMVGRQMVQARLGKRLSRVDGFLSANPFTMALLIRLLPAGSNLLTSLAAGVSSVAAGPFFAGSLVGYVPQTVVFALLGSGINIDPELRISVSIALFAASALLGVYLFRRFREVS